VERGSESVPLSRLNVPYPLKLGHKGTGRMFMTQKTSVLLVGLLPERANLSSFPGLTVEKLKAGLDAAIEELRTQGFEAAFSGIPPEAEPAEATVVADLARLTPDVVIIGAGVRTVPEHFLLFERLINLVHRQAPQARIGFNTRPDDTVQAVQRWARR